MKKMFSVEALIGNNRWNYTAFAESQKEANDMVRDHIVRGTGFYPTILTKETELINEREEGHQKNMDVRR